MARVRRNGTVVAGHRREPRPGRRGPAVGRRRRAGRPAPVPRRPPAARPQRPHRRIDPGAGSHGAGCRRQRPGRPAVDRLRRNERRRRARGGDRGRHRPRDRARPDRGWVGRSRSAAIAAAGRARPARPDPPVGRDRADRDRHVAGVHSGPGRRRDDPRRHLGRDRRDPRGAADPPRGRPRPGCLPPPQAGRARAPAERGGVARRGRPDHHRQDRDADPQPARRGIGPDPGRPGRGRRRPVGDPARCAPRGGGRLGDRWRLAAQLVHPLADAGGRGGRAGGAPRSRRAPRCRAGLRCPSVRPHPGPAGRPGRDAPHRRAGGRSRRSRRVAHDEDRVGGPDRGFRGDRGADRRPCPPRGRRPDRDASAHRVRGPAPRRHPRGAGDGPQWPASRRSS